MANGYTKSQQAVLTHMARQRAVAQYAASNKFHTDSTALWKATRQPTVRSVTAPRQDKPAVAAAIKKKVMELRKTLKPTPQKKPTNLNIGASPRAIPRGRLLTETQRLAVSGSGPSTAPQKKKILEAVTPALRNQQLQNQLVHDQREFLRWSALKTSADRSKHVQGTVHNAGFRKRQFTPAVPTKNPVIRHNSKPAPVNSRKLSNSQTKNNAKPSHTVTDGIPSTSKASQVPAKTTATKVPAKTTVKTPQTNAGKLKTTLLKGVGNLKKRVSGKAPTPVAAPLFIRRSGLPQYVRYNRDRDLSEPTSPVEQFIPVKDPHGTQGRYQLARKMYSVPLQSATRRRPLPPNSRASTSKPKSNLQRTPTNSAVAGTFRASAGLDAWRPQNSSLETARPLKNGPSTSSLFGKPLTPQFGKLVPNYEIMTQRTVYSGAGKPCECVLHVSLPYEPLRDQIKVRYNEHRLTVTSEKYCLSLPVVLRVDEKNTKTEYLWEKKLLVIKLRLFEK